MHQVALMVPERGPLRARGHLIVREHRAHVGYRVLKNSCCSKFPEILAVEGKLKRAEHCIGIWGHLTFEPGFNRKRNERRWCNSRRISDRWRICDRRRERYRGRKRDRRAKCNGGCKCNCGGWRKVLIGNWLTEKE